MKYVTRKKPGDTWCVEALDPSHIDGGYTVTDFAGPVAESQAAAYAAEMNAAAEWDEQSGFVSHGLQCIANERRRQIEIEGFVADHDDKYVGAHMAFAAMCYLLPFTQHEIARVIPTPTNAPLTFLGAFWPWAPGSFKQAARHRKATTDDRIRDLTKAGALIAAEIDRLQRINERGQFTAKDG